jgi:hypothetical protein
MRALEGILEELSQLYLQVKLTTGFGDAINGYGWHVIYHVDVIETIEFCSKCRANKSVNYFEDYYPNHHQHAHSYELKSIFTGTYIDSEKLIQRLEALLISRKTLKQSVNN